MADIDKLKIEINRDECIGDGACCNEAPETFELDDDSIAIIKDGSTDTREAILEAARACPTEVITVEDKGHRREAVPRGLERALSCRSARSPGIARGVSFLRTLRLD